MSKKKHEEHEEHLDESWLVPYADVLTLLLALFIVLFATSKVEQEKFTQMSDTFRGIFGGAGLVDGPGRGIGGTGGSTDGGGTGVQFNETELLNHIKDRFDAYIKENSLQGQLETRFSDEGLVLEVKSNLLFESGSAVLLPEGQRVAQVVADIVSTTDQNIVVSGHTDNMPINTAEFPTNWDLSSKRAINFMRSMLENDKDMNPARFSATGYGEFRPVSPNITEAGRAKNRRIELLIMRTYKVTETK